MNKKAVITFLILMLTSGAFAKEKIDEVKSAYMSGSYEQAYKLCIQALKENYSNGEVHYYLGLCYLQQGRLNDAKAEFQNVITIAPGSKFAKYSKQGIQNIFEEQNREYVLAVETTDTVSAPSNTSYKMPARPPRSKTKSYASKSYKSSNIDLGDGENYFFNAANSAGKIVRWDKNFPVNIYVPSKDFGYGDSIKSAFSTWKSACSSLKFEYTNSPVNADIIVHLKDKLENNTDKFDKGGYAMPTFKNGLLDKVDIFTEVKEQDGSVLHQSKFYNVMVHEIGHALGIWGHSDKKEDVMFPINMPSVRQYRLSQRDINTIQALYKSDADITNKTHGNSSSSVLLANKDTAKSAKETKIAEVKKYADLMPDNPDNWVNLGQTYETYNEDRKAMESYAMAIAVDNNHIAANSKMASMYYKLKKYPNAIKVYKKLVKLEPSNSTHYQNLVGLHLNLNKLNEANYWYDQLIENHPSAKKDKTVQGLKKQLDARKKAR